MGLNEALYELFLVDQQVRGLAGRLDGARRHVRAHEVRIEQIQRQLDELSDQLRRTKATEANLESEAEGFEQRIDKLRRQMNTAKTNREYSAFLVEVNTLKVEKGKVEDRALALMGDVEQLQERVREAERKLAEQRRIKAVADQELEARRAEVGEQIEELKRQRAEAAEKVPPEPLAVFERLADTLDGEAMAAVEQEDPRRMEYTCGGCYMAIPMEKVNQLMTQDTLVRCSTCTRILYLGQETRERMGIRS